MPKPEISPELFRREIPFKRKIEQKGPWLSIKLVPPEAKIEEIKREKSEEEKIFENVMNYIENPEKRSERWEKFLAHSHKAMESFADISPEGKIIPVDGKKETLGLYMESYIMEKFPEAAAALIKGAQDKFGENTKILVGPTAEEPDIPLPEKVLEWLNNCDNVLFVIGLSKQRAIKELWHLEKRASKSVIEAMGWDPIKVKEKAALLTFIDNITQEEGYDIIRYLKRLRLGKPRIGMLSLRKESALLDETYEADPKEIQERLEVLENYFKEAKTVHLTSKDGKTNLILDAENCPLSKVSLISREAPFGSIPIAGHFGFNPNNVEGKLLANLHVGKIGYTPEKFPDLKIHPMVVELKQGKIVKIKGVDEEGEKVAEALRKQYEKLAKIVKEAGGNPEQVYQVVEFGFYTNPVLTKRFENQTKEKYVKGGDFRICETAPHLGTCGSYNMPDAQGNLKELKGTSVHIDIMWDGFYENQGKIEIEYKNGTRKVIMEDGKWVIFKEK